MAACPRIFGPRLSPVARGRQPRSTRAASNSSAVGLWGQTATAMIAPSHVES